MAQPATRLAAAILLAILTLVHGPECGLAADDDASTTFDGLVRIEDASVAKA